MGEKKNDHLRRRKRRRRTTTTTFHALIPFLSVSSKAFVGALPYSPFAEFLLRI